MRSMTATSNCSVESRCNASTPSTYGEHVMTEFTKPAPNELGRLAIVFCDENPHGDLLAARARLT